MAKTIGMWKWPTTAYFDRLMRDNSVPDDWDPAEWCFIPARLTS